MARTLQVESINSSSTGLDLQTLNTSRLFIKSDGNVGIGGTPSSLLHLQGTSPALRIQASSGNTGALDFYRTASVNSGQIASDSNNALVLSTNTSTNSGLTERLRIDSSGNVGIGTASPATKLTVSGTSGTGSELRIISTTANTGGKITLYEGTSGCWEINPQNGANGPLIIKDIFNNTERLRIDSSGNVGIGSSTNVAPVVGSGRYISLYNTSHATISIQAVDGTNDRNATLELLSSGNGGSTSDIVFGDTDTTPLSPSPLRFMGRHNGSTTERLRIDSSGRVGIGTSSPDATLQVVRATSQTDIDGANQVATFINSSSDASGNLTGIRLRQENATNAAQGYIGLSSTGSSTTRANLVIATPNVSGNATERLRIDSNGSVGIGTNNPNTRLHVDSSTAAQYARFNSTATNGGYMTFESSSTVHGDIGTAAQVVSGGSVSDFGINARGSRNLILGTNNIERFRISSGGAISTSGSYTTTKANDTADGGGQIYLNGATGNRIDFNTNGVAAPAFTTRSAGTKIVLYPAVSATGADYAFGIDTGTLWSSVPSTSQTFKWYGGTTLAATLTGAGNFTAVGNVTAYSDERVKTNWRNLTDNFIEKLAKVKSGIFDRIDFEENDLNKTQVGVSAQSLQEIMPNAVISDKEGKLSVSYGNAALASCIELAKEILKLKEEIAKLKRE